MVAIRPPWFQTYESLRSLLISFTDYTRYKTQEQKRLAVTCGSLNILANHRRKPRLWCGYAGSCHMCVITYSNERTKYGLAPPRNTRKITALHFAPTCCMCILLTSSSLPSTASCRAILALTKRRKGRGGDKTVPRTGEHKEAAKRGKERAAAKGKGRSSKREPEKERLERAHAHASHEQEKRHEKEIREAEKQSPRHPPS